MVSEDPLSSVLPAHSSWRMGLRSREFRPGSKLHSSCHYGMTLNKAKAGLVHPVGGCGRNGLLSEKSQSAISQLA